MTVPTFLDGARSVMAHLAEHAPLDLWLLTRVDVVEQTVLASEGPWAGRFPVGSVVPWLDSLCLHMVGGSVPASTTRVQDVSRYAAAARGQWAGVQGCTGVPLMCGDGVLYGTLAGFSGHRDDARVSGAGVVLSLAGSLLSNIATAEVQGTTREAALVEARDLAETDALTGLRNRRAWQVALATESGRCSRYGSGAGVFAIDLDRLKTVNDTSGHCAGDALLRSTADVLRHVCRPTDILARPGGDEFAVLAVGLDPHSLPALTRRLEQRLAEVGISASIAGAVHVTGEHLADTWHRADLAMYANKRRRRADGTVSVSSCTVGAAVDHA